MWIRTLERLRLIPFSSEMPEDQYIVYPSWVSFEFWFLVGREHLCVVLVHCVNNTFPSRYRRKASTIKCSHNHVSQE